MLPPAFVDVDGPLDSAVPVCNCHRRRNSLPGPGKFNTVHHSSPGHAAPVNSPSAPVPVQPVPQIIQAPAPPVVAQDVPEQYIVDQLHRLGAFYWHKPETTDCTIREFLLLLGFRNNGLTILQKYLWTLVVYRKRQTSMRQVVPSIPVYSPRLLSTFVVVQSLFIIMERDPRLLQI